MLSENIGSLRTKLSGVSMTNGMAVFGRAACQQPSGCAGSEWIPSSCVMTTACGQACVNLNRPITGPQNLQVGHHAPRGGKHPRRTRLSRLSLKSVAVGSSERRGHGRPQADLAIHLVSFLPRHLLLLLIICGKVRGSEPPVRHEYESEQNESCRAYFHALSITAGRE